MTLMYRYLLSIALFKRLCIGSYKKCCPANMNELQKILGKTVSARAGTILHIKLELPLYFIPEIAWIIFLLYSWNLFETGWSSNFTLKKQKLTSETNFYHAQSSTQYANKYHFAQWLFWGIFVRKVFYTNLNLRYQKIKKISKNKGTFVTSTSKVDYLVATFFQISYSSVPKMRFVFDTFLQRFPKTAIVFGQMIWFMFWAVIKHVGYLCHNEVKLFHR